MIFPRLLLATIWGRVNGKEAARDESRIKNTSGKLGN
jgi:hypothetical protein